MKTDLDYRTINNDYNFYRKQKEFTLDALSEYDGKYGRPAYVAIDGIVYDINNNSTFKAVKNMEVIAGKDLTEILHFYYTMNQIINEAPKIGVLNYNNDIECKINKVRNEKEKQDTYKSMRDQWINCIDPLVKYVMGTYQATDSSYNCNNCILLDGFAELEKTLQESMKQVQEWQTKVFTCEETKNGLDLATGETETSIGAKDLIGSPTGSTGLVGGAIGGAGGGFGTSSQGNVTLSKSQGNAAETEIKLGPGATGGATGGALGGSTGGTSRTAPEVDDLRELTENT